MIGLKSLVGLAASAASLAFGSAAFAAADRRCAIEGVQQLRIYEIFEHNKDAFHRRFRDHAERIMKRHGFEIVRRWESTHSGRTEFIYLLTWPDAEAMKRQWAAFLADEEWIRIKRETAAVHGDLVGEIEDRVLEGLDSPRCTEGRGGPVLQDLR
jgi:heme-degrading monooxygenase HmoA